MVCGRAVRMKGETANLDLAYIFEFLKIVKVPKFCLFVIFNLMPVFCPTAVTPPGFPPRLLPYSAILAADLVLECTIQNGLVVRETSLNILDENKRDN